MKKHLMLLLFLANTFLITAQNKFQNPKLAKTNIKIVLAKMALNLDKTPGLVIENGENGLPIFIKGKIANQIQTRQARGTVGAAVYGYLETIKVTLKIKAPQDEFLLGKIDEDLNSQQHIRLNQTYKGIPVYGGELIVHTRNNQTEMVNGRYFKTPNLSDITPAFSLDNVKSIALADVAKKSVIKEYSILEKTILKHKEAIPELIIYHPDGNSDIAKLSYRIEIRPNLVERWEYFIDAKTGEILNKYNTTCSLDGPATASASDLNGISRAINTYQVGASYALIDTKRAMFPGGAVNSEDPQGVLWTIDAGNTTGEELKVSQLSSSNNSWSNRTAVSAHYNAGIAYEYYKNTHARNSLNGRGGTIVSIINITETNETTGKAQQMDNAYWNGEFMGYGNGKDYFKPLAGGLDVAGHEMTHGVIENTANLNYQGQSGAINESMADVFGVLIDRQDGDWVVGEDVMKNGAPFLRSMSDPTLGGKSIQQGGQPADMTQIYRGTEDNGGVHINSGIPNRAFYLFATALTGTEDQKKAKAEKVYYRALTKYLTRSSQFNDLRSAIVQSCNDLKAEVGDNAVAAAEKAFATVGIGGSTGTTTPPTQKPVEDLPTTVGSEFILSYDPCEKAIYSSKEVVQSAADYRIVAPNVVLDHKPSVTDDGSFAYFVDITDHNIKRVNLTGTAKVDAVTTDKVWRNVAVSKDGQKLAAVTLENTNGDEKSIIIFNLKDGKPQQNKLYNPTYSNVKSAGSPLYADALAWDYGGEYLIYDGYNEIQKTGIAATAPTTSLDYWDVGIMKAWDNTKASFGDGTISKIFTSLAKNESIGNPSFAKRSTSVLAFDRVLNDKYSILTVDFETKGTDGSYKRAEIPNNTIGYPEFSAKDDKLIFNRLSTGLRSKVCTTDTTNTAAISMATDKVTASGTRNDDFIEKSALAVWYTIGTRALPTKQNQVITVPTTTSISEGNTTAIGLNANTDKSVLISYKLLSGPATVSNGKIIPTGKPGRIKVQADAAGSDVLNAVQNIIDICVNPSKPIISVTELANAILLQSSDDYTNTWFADGVQFKTNVKGIEITDAKSYTLETNVDGCKSDLSVAFKAGAAETQSISSVSVSNRLQGDTGSLDLPSKTDKGNNITYTIVSGPATVVGNKLTLTGLPGKVIVKGFSPAGLKYAAAETSFEFCVNPSKPTISITTQPDQYVFTSSASTGNNWYRNGTLLKDNNNQNVTSQSINVVSTNSFTVQVIVDGCKSDFSEAKVAPKEILLAEEELIRAGISIFPNPVSDVLNIKFANTRIIQVSIFNMVGNSIYLKENLKNGELIIDMKAIPMGIYILNLKTSKGEFNKKLMKE